MSIDGALKAGILLTGTTTIVLIEAIAFYAFWILL